MPSGLQVLLQRTGRRLLAPGEGLIASAALVAVASVVVAVGGTAWWAIQSESKLAAARAQAQSEHTMMLLAEGVGAMLSSGDLAALRRTTTEVTRDDAIDTVRIRLASGELLASSDLEDELSNHLPESWGGAAMAPVEAEPTGDGGARWVLPVTAAGGSASIEIVFAAPSRSGVPTAIMTGAAIAAAFGTIVVLVNYRRISGNLAVAGEIRTCLREMMRGVDDVRALTIDASVGPESEAWNALLNDRATLRSARAVEEIEHAVSSAPAAAGDAAAVFEQLWYGVLLFDADAAVVDANATAAVLLRSERDKIVGAPAGALLPSEAASALARLAKHGGRAREVYEVETDGGAVLRVTARALRSGGRASVVAIVEDVTQQRIADAAHSGFVAQATHELRTPLTNIRLYVEQAIEEGEANPRLRDEAINVIAAESRRLERIVGDMLSVSEMEAGSLAIKQDDMRVGQMLEGLERDFRAQAAEKDITLQFDLPPKLPVLHADRDKITLVLHNLLGNALKYTPAGGSVKVTYTEDEEGCPRFGVTDSGIGIAEDELERVFEKFYRSQDKRIGTVVGTGLGLALARDIARLHGGDITVESEIDKGSTFILELPKETLGAVRAEAA